jgi:hypothetical protein
VPRNVEALLDVMEDATAHWATAWLPPPAKAVA